MRTIIPGAEKLQFVYNDSNHYKFTGKERDAETGFDYFGARYYGNWYGRFLSADWAAKPEAVPYSDLQDPQSLNLYSYVKNIPTTRFDADGHCCELEIAFSKAVSNYFISHPDQYFAVTHPSKMVFDLHYSKGAWRNPNATNLTTNTVRFANSLGLSDSKPGMDAGLGTQVNAFRHVEWSASMTVKYGSQIATQATNSHEQNPYVDLSVRNFSGKNAAGKADQTADLLNNQIGRAIGEANPGASMAQLAGDYYHTNGLYESQPNADGSVSVVQTKLSDQDYANAKKNLNQLDQNGNKRQ
jgi:RHS repeat-associated protein